MYHLLRASETQPSFENAGLDRTYWVFSDRDSKAPKGEIPAEVKQEREEQRGEQARNYWKEKMQS